MISKYLTLLTLAPMWFSASAAAYFSAGPSSDRFPSNLTTANITGVIPVEDCYKHGFTREGWTVEAVESSAYSFVCPTHSETSTGQDSWLTTAPFIVEGNGSWLRWNAKSLLPGFPEAYDVVVVETAINQHTTIYSIDEEDFQWQTRLVSLDDFVGKEITVSFVCRSVNKYMLAVRDIFAGVPESSQWAIDNTPIRYAAVSDGATATGFVTNFGADAEGVSIYCKIGAEETLLPISETWQTGEIREYSFPLPLTLNEATTYSIGIKDSEGNANPLVSSDVFASHFKRTLFVDEGTGMWCNNCPDGILELDRLKREFGDDIVMASCHVNDPLAMRSYWDELKFYAVPYMMLNRDRQTQGSSSKDFSKAYQTPTTAEILLPSQLTATDGKVNVEATAQFAEELDNNDGRYKIGYTVVADIYSPNAENYYQQNSISFPRGEQYYILPTEIPASLARFDNAVIDDACAFSGIEGSLPQQINPLTGYSTSFSIELPEFASAAEEVRVVAYVLDIESGIMMNAASSVVSLSNGLGTMNDTAAGNVSISILPSGECVVTGVDELSEIDITVADAQGRMFDRFAGTPSQAARHTFRYPAGLAIISAHTPQGSGVAKYISKK